MSADQSSSTGGSDPGAPSSGVPPGQQIDELRKKSKEEQDKRKDAELKIQQIEAQIAAIGQVTEDIDKIAADYTKDYDGLVAARQDDRNFETDEKKCLANILGSAVNTVTTTVSDLQKPIVALETSIATDAASLDTYKTTRDTNDGARNAKKKAFDDLKTTGATIKNYQKDPLDGLEREIKAAQDTGKFAVAYWLLVGRFSGRLQSAPAIVAPNDLRAKLLQARDDYVTAIANFYASDTQVKAAEKALDAKRAALADLKKNFEIEVREKLSKIDPQRQAA